MQPSRLGSHRVLISRLIQIGVGAAMFAMMGLPTGAALAAAWDFDGNAGPSTCALRYVDSKVTLHFLRRSDGEQAYMYPTGADLPEEFSFYWQTNSGPRHRMTAHASDETGGYLFAGGKTGVSANDLLLELEPVDYLKLVITQHTILTVDMSFFEPSFAAYRSCVATLSPTPRNETAKTSEKTSDQQDIEAEENDEPVDLAENLKAMPTTIVGEFLCEVSSSDLLGIPDFNGNDQSTTVTLRVFEDGRATYNGSPLSPEVNEKAADGNIVFVTYDVRNILKATGPDPSVPPVAGLSQEEMNAYGAFLGAGNTMMQTVLGDRSRSLFVSLKDGTVVFLDHKNGRDISNQRAPQCARTQ